jgi:hypothetical protein
MPPSALFGTPKTIFIVSPQPWDGLKVSKHHYAEELARHGHAVWFINPPVDAGLPRGKALVSPTEIECIRQVTYRTWFPYSLKFKARALFDLGMRKQALLLAEEIGCSPDFVWDFDNAYQFSDLSAFGARRSIFHLMDEPGSSRVPTKGAHLILSVAGDFLKRISKNPEVGHIIAHGLSRLHETYAQQIIKNPRREFRARGKFCVGYVGNLDHPGIDWATIRSLAETFPQVAFRFIGPCGTTGQAITARSSVKACPNVSFDGPKSAAAILQDAHTVDIWLICYDPTLTLNGATNSHKALEYLATGNPILANSLHAYADTDLLVMPDMGLNEEIPRKLAWILEHWSWIDGPDARSKRAEYALAHSYTSHTQKISALLDRLSFS